MSEKQFEQCTLEDATHVEMGGKVHELGYDECNQVVRYSTNNIEVRKERLGWQLINVDAFQILGIKPMREKKPEPIEFEATFVKYDNHWHPLYSLDYGFPCQKYKTARFKCVQILEDEK